MRQSMSSVAVAYTFPALAMAAHWASASQGAYTRDRAVKIQGFIFYKASMKSGNWGQPSPPPRGFGLTINLYLEGGYKELGRNSIVLPRTTYWFKLTRNGLEGSYSIADPTHFWTHLHKRHTHQGEHFLAFFIVFGCDPDLHGLKTGLACALTPSHDLPIFSETSQHSQNHL